MMIWTLHRSLLRLGRNANAIPLTKTNARQALPGRGCQLQFPSAVRLRLPPPAPAEQTQSAEAGLLIPQLAGMTQVSALARLPEHAFVLIARGVQPFLLCRTALRGRLARYNV